MFTTFTDRDGKFQLLALAESGFDPLARTCRFMLTEEAHHLFVGQTGVQRVIRRSCELMKQFDSNEIAAFGGIDLNLLQKYINFWYASSLDLFGSEVSSNAASYFAAGLKGRAYEEKLFTDHKALRQTHPVEIMENGKPIIKDLAMRTVMNELLREAYAHDCQKALDKWNKEVADLGIDFKFALPSRRFNRTVGEFAGWHFDPSGLQLSKQLWEQESKAWLPTVEDRNFVKSLMVAVTKPGHIAGWIAPPSKGINGQALDYCYVHLS